jgi:hypothetical protein
MAESAGDVARGPDASPHRGADARCLNVRNAVPPARRGSVAELLGSPTHLSSLVRVLGAN